MPITSLRFTNVGPFDDIEFEFDEHVNVFTGPNNSGKTTALMVLGELFVFPFALPAKLLRAEEATWGSSFLVGGKSKKISGVFPLDLDVIYSTIKGCLEEIGYTTLVPSLRLSTDYRSEGPSVTQKRNTDLEDQIAEMAREQPEIFAERSASEFHRQIREREGSDLQKRRALFSPDASMVIDEEVIQKIIELDYRAYRRNQPAIRDILARLASVASDITQGFPVHFLGVGEDETGLYPRFKTPTGEVPLNVLSQGTQSIVQWLGRFLIGYAEYYDFPAQLEEKPGVLIIDEIDAHLHPSWQRRIIPTLISHFPNLQIFCSTHSPLMLAGLKEGQVQLLKRDEKGKVTVSRNETDIIGWSADEILRNFLDVPSPTDLGTTGHIERLQELRRKDTLSDDESLELEQLRHTVSQDLMDGPMAQQVENLSEVLRTYPITSAPRKVIQAQAKCNIAR